MLDALPPELREQIEQAWNHKQVPDTSFHPATSQQSFTEAPSVLLHLPDQPGQTGSTGIILELPDFSQVSFSCQDVMFKSDAHGGIICAWFYVLCIYMFDLLLQ